MKSNLLRTLFEDISPSEYIAMRAIKDKTVKSLYTHSVSDAEGFVEKHCSDMDVYFGVCTRNKPLPEIEHVCRAYAVWADLDPYHTSTSDKLKALQKTLRNFVLSPSIIVDSGGGYHLYWQIEPTEDLEAVTAINKLFEDLVVGAGQVADVARILRVDNTYNYKHEHPRPVSVTLQQPKVYSLTDLKAVTRLPKKFVRKIITGDGRGFKTRSERDWAVIRALIGAGFSDEAITDIFNTHKIGDKVREKNGFKYFEHTLAKARDRAGDVNPENVEDAETNFAGIFEEDDCYWMMTSAGTKVQLSTFTFEPEILLHGKSVTDIDTLVGTISAAGYTWPDIPLTRKAFVRSDTLIKELPLAAWQWLGPDSVVKKLLPYLMVKLRSKGLPKRTATTQVGYFMGYWLGSSQTVGSGGVVDVDNREVAILPTKGERPNVTYSEAALDPTTLEEFMRLYSGINEPGVVWPALGWLAACPYKSRLADQLVRFPMLNLFGTRGSGKTSLITQVLQPLMGYDKGITYDCTTKQFVMLSLFGSSNGVPVAFSEYRKSSRRAAQQMLHYLLLAYDTGHDPRGRPDQSVIDYPLDAPFSIDGEDAISDPAALERMVQICMHPEDIEEDTPAFENFQELILVDLKSIGTAYIQHTLENEPLWGLAFQLVKQAFPQRLADRTRRNLAVVTIGLLSFESFAKAHGVAVPKVDMEFIRASLSDCLENIINLATGRSMVLVDELVEDVINEAGLTNGMPRFVHTYDSDLNIVWFQLSTAMTWWLPKRRLQDRPVLDSAAVKSQLMERFTANGSLATGQYVVGRKPKTIDNRTYWCYGVDLSIAHEIGLDVPMRLETFRVRTAEKTERAGKNSASSK